MNTEQRRIDSFPQKIYAVCAIKGFLTDRAAAKGFGVSLRTFHYWKENNFPPSKKKVNEISVKLRIDCAWWHLPLEVFWQQIRSSDQFKNHVRNRNESDVSFLKVL